MTEAASHEGGKRVVLPGLTRRRKAEHEIMVQGIKRLKACGDSCGAATNGAGDGSGGGIGVS